MRHPRARRNSGAEDPDDRPTIKSALAAKLNDLISASRLSQAQVGRLLKMPQPRISAIRNNRLHGISLERLMQALTAFGQDVDIVVMPSTRSSRARIYVAV